ncbi:hypothetical protein EGW08_011543 [Elysia chlorotica]|uniref:Uncharacterized protein n=1 Tax=Elysia chlorotica TaxID=188477 RepID=A0A3S1A236_ELYCH|nr:hypothetical protein EGW08_011543 [Elysia chlorotica]
MRHLLSLTILLVITVCTDVTESRARVPITKRGSGPETYLEVTPQWRCEVHLYRTCFDPNLNRHRASLNSKRVLAETLQNRTLLGAFSGDFQRAMSCVDVELGLPGCAGVDMADSFIESHLPYYRLQAAYLNNSAHLDILQAAGASPCLTNSSFTRPAEAAVYLCYVSFVQHRHAPCQAVSTLRACSVDAVSHTCGAAAAEFIQSIWDLIMDDAEARAHITERVGMPKLAEFVDRSNPANYLLDPLDSEQVGHGDYPRGAVRVCACA